MVNYWISWLATRTFIPVFLLYEAFCLFLWNGLLYGGASLFFLTFWWFLGREHLIWVWYLVVFSFWTQIYFASFKAGPLCFRLRTHFMFMHKSWYLISFFSFWIFWTMSYGEPSYKISPMDNIFYPIHSLNIFIFNVGISSLNRFSFPVLLPFLIFLIISTFINHLVKVDCKIINSAFHFQFFFFRY